VIFSFESAQEGSTARYTAENLSPSRHLPHHSEMQRFNALAGFPTVADGIAILRLSPGAAHPQAAGDHQELAPKLAQIPGVRAFPTNPPSLGQSPRNRPVEFCYEFRAVRGHRAPGGALPGEARRTPAS